MNSDCHACLQSGHLEELHALLRKIEARLGTAAERPGDLDCARAVAHRIISVVHGTRLKAEVDKLEPGK